MVFRSLTLLAAALLAPAGHALGLQSMATGVVFEDRNANGVRDRGEPGLVGVRVTNRVGFTRTDREGRWQLPVDDDTIFSVIKPRGWITPIDKNGLPKFYRIHKPAGSPAFKFAGVAPTGALPASIDFPLRRHRESSKFSALFFGDTQPRDLREVDYIFRSIVDPLIGEREHAFGVTLGDIVFDDLSVTQPLVEAIGRIGIPWYYVIGNHDLNLDAADDAHSDEFFESVFGPSYYAFDYGPTHFVVLDDVFWSGPNPVANVRGSYKAALGPVQLEWFRRDLEQVSPDQLVVVMMHIPLNELEEKDAVFRILETRPYALSVSAHTHFQEHRFFTAKEGWRGAKPHHHVVNVTACGSWWSGAPDPFGVPHTTMRGGAPNGYAIFRFDGNEYAIEFRAAGRPADYQMHIIAPDALLASETRGTTVYANVFGGSEFSVVEMKFADGPWIPMRKVLVEDPDYVAMFKRDASLLPPYRALPAPIPSPHLWKSALPKVESAGVYPIHVRTTDMFGQTYLGTRIVRIDAG
ncbi:MAG: calcineurin-like phosphoesterase family protein [Fimbriimonadaceae bacterium]|nr:calcineurin-like phosphoesterase family protein [Fimbriimonadaceae bacterium]